MKHPLQPLIDHFSKLPGVGPKSAQRLAFHVLSMPLGDVQGFANTLRETRENMRYCERCFHITTMQYCDVCMSPKRDVGFCCVVAHPKDVMAIERTASYQGIYHVLGGLLSPLDGMHPQSLRIPELISRVKQTPFREIVLAISPTIEGEATALYLAEVLAPYRIPLSKLAYGLPVGADMDYTDELTLQRALMGRTPMEQHE
jgi:recombination protein RecR